MTRKSDDKSEATRLRNAEAMRRLQQLLSDPGPGITVRRVDSSEQFARSEVQSVAPVEAAPKPAPASTVIEPEPQPKPKLEEPKPASSSDERATLQSKHAEIAEPQASHEAAAPPSAVVEKPVTMSSAPVDVSVDVAAAAVSLLPLTAAPALELTVSSGPVSEAVSIQEPIVAEQAPVIEPPAPQLEPDAAPAAPMISSQERLRQRMQRAAQEKPALTVAPPAPERRVAQPTLAAPVSTSAQQPTESPAQPPVASPAERRAENAEQLKHMPASVRGKLAAFLGDKAAARVTVPAAPPAAEAASKRQAGPPVRPGDSELWTALIASRRPFMAAGLFSFVINILMLAGPLFMLQVYDRVLTSGSLSTLLALTVLTSAMYGIIGLLELARTRIIVRMGTEIDQRVSDRIFRASLRKTLSNPSASLPALRELDNVRQFAGSQGPLTFFDAPWTPIYLFVIAMVHWALGLTAVIGAALLLVITWASERRSREPLTEAGKAMGRSIELAEAGQRNAESLTAMGMITAYRDRWQEANWDALSWQMRAADRLGSMSAFSKALRLFLQSLMLAIGAALAVNGEISAGSIIAGTIIFGRALAPIEQAISHWKGYLKARESFGRLDSLLKSAPEPPVRLALQAPRGRLEVEGLRVAAPDTRHLILSNVGFFVEPGQMLAVIGPSASGKSTLARTLVGLWQPAAGSIRLDGARLDQWDPEALGAHIGFLPQNVELFAGSVRDNIARFRRDATDDEITEAARAAHAHDLIMALPQGYETQLGAFGTYLSSGQRQRIALSRALFRHPALVVLDEPNSNLDRDGDEALASAIDGMRKRGQAVILVSHRVQAIGKADLLLYLDRGTQKAFGPRREVMKLFQGSGPDAGAAPAAGPAGRAPTAKSGSK